MTDPVDKTGPEYPVINPPGSNAIGQFAIGVSPVGDIAPFDVWETVVSQYANSPTITTLLTNFSKWIDQTKNFSDFFDMIMDVDGAVKYGLDVWGRIVGVNRILKMTTPGAYFGFQEAGDAVGFNQAPFYTGAPLTTNYELSDEAYRKLILTKAMANISQCSIPVLNQMLLSLFPNRGNCYVTEGSPPVAYFGFQEAGDAVGFDQAPFYSGQHIDRMVMIYTFDFSLSPVELAIVRSSGVLPKPTGVRALVVINA